MKRIFLIPMILAASLSFSVPAYAARVAPKTATVSFNSADLDGNGRNESVKIRFSDVDYDRYMAFRITVNGQSMDVQGDQIDAKVYLINIDKGDTHKEIAVCEDGPSSDPRTYIFGFYDGKLCHLGTLYGAFDWDEPEYTLQGTGTGKLYSPQRSELLQTWWYRTTYTLDAKKHTLVLSKQNVYACIGTFDLTVTKSFQVYSARSTTAARYTLQKGDTIRLTGTDEKQWVSFHDANGKTGWIRLSLTDYGEIYGAGMADEYLDGLAYYD